MAPMDLTEHGEGLTGAVKLVVRTFLEQEHYSKLHSILSERWSDMRALTAAVKLLESHNVKISPEMEKRLYDMPEDKMIDVLVSQMPSQSQEAFEHFFLQLSLIASTQTRLRDALDKGDTASMEMVMDSADDVGITPYILKMAVVQAGQQVKSLDEDADVWIALTSNKMGPMLSGQEDAMRAMKKLNEATAALTDVRASANDKSRKVLMGLMGGQAAALQASCFISWLDITKRMKQENEIRKEYAERIDAAEKRLLEYTSTQMNNVKGVLLRKAAEDDNALLQLVIDTFRGDVEERKADADAADEVRAIEMKLAGYAGDQAANTKKVLARMNAGTDGALTQMIFQGWITFSKDYKKNKDIEEEVRKAEAKVAEFMAKQNEGAKSVLSRMSNSSDTGLLSNVTQAWIGWVKEEQSTRQMQELMEANAAKFGSFVAGRNGASGGAMERAALMMDEASICPCFHAWKRECKVEQKKRVGKVLNDAKKKQVHDVQNMFKNFAQELDTNLKDVTPAPSARRPAQKS